MIFHNLCLIEQPYVGNCILLPENIPTSLCGNDDWEAYPMKIVSLDMEATYKSFNTHGLEYHDDHPCRDAYSFRKHKFKHIMSNKIKRIVKL